MLCFPSSPLRSGGVLALVFVFALVGCKPEPANSQGAATVSVRVAPVTAGETVEAPLRFAGVVRAVQRATLTFQVSGTLRERPVELGQSVNPGQLLARLYNPALQPARDSAAARLRELETRFDQAQREWQRASRLHERGVVSEQELEQLAARRDALRAGMATAEAELAEASRLLEESVLRAPFAGQVEALPVEPDEFVSAGQPVVRLASPSGLEVEVRLPAYLLDRVAPGQSLPVWLVRQRDVEPWQGTVVEVARGSAVRGELHPVLVSLPPASMETGAPVEVGIMPERNDGVSVPLLAVIRDANGAAVYRVRDSVVERVPVTVDRVMGERAILANSPLTSGEQVVYAGMSRLVDGDRVEIH